MENNGEALWRDSKYYNIRYAIPINGYNGELFFVLFMDNDRAILHRSEVRCQNQSLLYYPSDTRFFTSTKTINLMNTSILSKSIDFKSSKASPVIEDAITEHVSQKQSTGQIWTGLSLSNLADIFLNVLNSDAIDPTGERTGRPLFDRNEPEISMQVASFLLNNQYPTIVNSQNEMNYTSSNDRCDIVLQNDSGQLIWIELKQSWEKQCTDWRTAFSKEEYLKDIKKLRNIPDDSHSVLMHIAYRQTSYIPDDFPIGELQLAMTDYPFEWRHFSMPTKDHGKCICHVIIWLLK